MSGLSLQNKLCSYALIKHLVVSLTYLVLFVFGINNANASDLFFGADSAAALDACETNSSIAAGPYIKRCQYTYFNSAIQGYVTEANAGGINYITRYMYS